MYVRKEIGLNASKILSTKTGIDLKFATCCSCVAICFLSSLRRWILSSHVICSLWRCSYLPLVSLPSSSTPHPTPALNKFQNCLDPPPSFPRSSRLFLHTLTYLAFYTHVGYSSLQEGLFSRLFLYQLQARCSPHTQCSAEGIAFFSGLLSHLASESQLP